MDVKKTRERLLKAAENSIEELIKVMNKKMDPEELDPEKVKISASAYRLAMEDAIAMMAKVEELKRVFEDKSLNELSGLKFTTEEDSLKLGTNMPGHRKPPPPPPSQMIKEGEDPRPKLKPEYLKDMDNKNKIKQNGSSKELSKNS